MCEARCLIGRGEASKGARCPRGCDVNWGEMSGSRQYTITIIRHWISKPNNCQVVTRSVCTVDPGVPPERGAHLDRGVATPRSRCREVRHLSREFLKDNPR